MFYFTADLHFNHANILKYTNRPWSTVSEMNDGLIENWNSVVSPKDSVYILGDFCWKNTREIMARLNGKKILIVGSHDKDSLRPITRDQFTSIHVGFHAITVNKRLIVLCHYCMRTWPRSHYGTWHLFGHSHGRLEPMGLSWDVGVDNNNFAPVSVLEIEKILGRPLVTS